jgi:hypothetical protein
MSALGVSSIEGAAHAAAVDLPARGSRVTNSERVGIPAAFVGPRVATILMVDVCYAIIDPRVRIH